MPRNAWDKNYTCHIKNNVCDGSSASSQLLTSSIDQYLEVRGSLRIFERCSLLFRTITFLLLRVVNLNLYHSLMVTLMPKLLLHPFVNLHLLAVPIIHTRIMLIRFPVPTSAPSPKNLVLTSQPNYTGWFRTLRTLKPSPGSLMVVVGLCRIASVLLLTILSCPLQVLTLVLCIVS